MNSSQFATPKPIELIPSGIQSLDAIIGGGFQIGSIVTLLTDEDAVLFSDMFIKLFISQGVVSADHVLFASCDATKQFLQLPRPCEVNQEAWEARPSEPMKIAFRYETNFRERMDLVKHASSSCNFQFNHKMSNEMLESSSLMIWPTDSSYGSLLRFIEQEINSKNLSNEESRKYPNKSILRVCLHNLGSFLWEEGLDFLPKFLYRLRRLVHNARTVAFVTLPTSVVQDSSLARCEQLSDTVFRLESIDVTANPLFGEYSGLIDFIKASPVNSLASQMVDRKDWAFKFVKKRLLIERLSLPPEVNTPAQSEQMTCSSTTSKLDF